MGLGYYDFIIYPPSNPLQHLATITFHLSPQKANEGVEEVFQYLADKFHTLSNDDPDQILQLE